MSERHFQTSAGTTRGKIDPRSVLVGGRDKRELVVVTRCHDCSAGETIHCGRFGRRIQYPISGPIPGWCRLKNAGEGQTGGQDDSSEQ